MRRRGKARTKKYVTQPRRQATQAVHLRVKYRFGLMKRFPQGMLLALVLWVSGFAGVLSAWTEEGISDRSIQSPVALARQAVFQDAKRRIAAEAFAAQDPGYEVHQAAIREGKFRDGSQKVTGFSGGFYSVALPLTEEKDWEEQLYYSSRGQLKAIERRNVLGECVRRYTYLYGGYAEKLGLQSGQLLFAAIACGDGEEEFIFDTTGRLHGHWRGEVCFRADGTRCLAGGKTAKQSD